MEDKKEQKMPVAKKHKKEIERYVPPHRREENKGKLKPSRFYVFDNRAHPLSENGRPPGNPNREFNRYLYQVAEQRYGRVKNDNDLELWDRPADGPRKK